MKQPAEEPKELKKLSKKHQHVLDVYLTCWNKTKAYKASYPDITHNSAKAAASRLFKDPDFSAHVSAALDAVHLSYEEALALLADYARGDIDEFLDDDGNFDIEKARKAGITHIIKEIEREERISKDGDITARTKLKLHDPLAAIDKVLRVQGRYKDTLDLNVKKVYRVTIKKDND